MIDIDPESTCRICLEDGAIYPLFESNDEFEGMHAKLPACIREKIENIEGYPRKICLKCKNTSDTICSFKSKFEETCKILEIKIVKVKTEIQDSLDISDNDFDSNDDHKDFLFELQLDNYPVKTKPEKQNTTELLEPLKHLTVKKIKVKSEPEEDSELVEVKKRGRPSKATKASGNVTKTKAVSSKATAGRKPAAKPACAKVKEKVAARTTNTDLSAEVALSAKKLDMKKYCRDHPSLDLCEVCGKAFPARSYLAQHMRIHTGVTPYSCPVCGRAYTQVANMKSHIFHNHRLSDLAPEDLARIKPELLKHFKPLAKIKELIRQKQEKLKVREDQVNEPDKEGKSSKNKSKRETTSLCDICGAAFSRPDRLSYHRRNAHGEKNYKCTKCPRSFRLEAYLSKHVKRLHDKEVNVLCDHCGKGFYSKKQISAHINQVHLGGKKYTITKCGFCDKTFRYKRGALIHERAVHTGERPSKCGVCGSSFFDDVYLQEHMRLHTGETPHKCPVCGRGYAQRGNMKSHMRNHKISDLSAEMLAKIKPSYFKFMRP